MGSFYADIEAQLDHLAGLLKSIFDAHERAEVGVELDAAVRISTREFISGIKYLLDQLTLRMWDTYVAPHMSIAESELISSKVYYPYDLDGQRLSSRIGQIVPPAIRANADCALFISWLQSCQPSSDERYASLASIGELSRTAHRHLVMQSKEISACSISTQSSPNGGGGFSATFNGIPPAFAVVTWRVEASGEVGIANITGRNVKAPNFVPADAIVEILQFDPDTMKFEDFPGAVTAVVPILECRVGGREFDAIEMFAQAGQAVEDIASTVLKAAPE